MFKYEIVRMPGLMYKCDVTLLLKWHNDWPEFGILEKILVKKEDKFFGLHKL